MLFRTLLFLSFASVALAASPLTDHDPELVKTRELLVANQELSIAMTMADLSAARAINSALSPQQLAHWKRLQSDLAEQRPNEARRRTIFDYEKQLALTPLQVSSLRHQIESLNKLLEESRTRMSANLAEIRNLHPDLGLTEQAQLPRPSTLVTREKELALSGSQVSFAKQVNDRLAGLTEECRRRVAANAETLRPLLANDAPLEHIKPFVRADAEVVTELTLASFRSSLSLHEKLNPKQREDWHISELTNR